jgi:indole-3-glycerol phosphate synthase
MVVKSRSKRCLSRGIDPSFLEAYNGMLAHAESLSGRDPGDHTRNIVKRKACSAPSVSTVPWPKRLPLDGITPRRLQYVYFALSLVLPLLIGVRAGRRASLGTPMSILDQILSDKADEVAERRRRRPLAELQRMVQDLPPARDFLAAVRDDGAASEIPPRVIAEVKKASPSRGVIRPDFDPVAIAQTYAANGAAALSILTDAKYFQGELSFLGDISKAVTLPLLRKDFTVNAYQVYESRVAHADALLLIVAALQTGPLEDFLGLAHELGMAALLEVHTVEGWNAVCRCTRI